MSGTTPFSCKETRTNRVVQAANPTNKSALSKNRGTSNARVRAKVDPGRIRNKMTRKAQVLRARVVYVSCRRIRVTDSLGTATSAANRAAEWSTAHNNKKCKP